VKAKVLDAGRFERGVPVRIEMLVGCIELRLAGLRVENHGRRGEQVLAARRVLKFQLAQRFERFAGERERPLLAVLGVVKYRAAGLQIHVSPFQRQELAATRADRDREQDERMKRRPFGSRAGIQ
jgi:hypothetical protein